MHGTCPFPDLRFINLLEPGIDFGVVVRSKRARFELILLGLSLYLLLLSAGILDYLGAVTLFPIALTLFIVGGLVVGGMFCIHGHVDSEDYLPD